MFTYAMSVRSAVIVVAFTTIGCTRVRVTTFDPNATSPQRTPASDIRFFDTQRPRCQFRELARITTRGGFLAAWSSVIRKTRERASRMGGDAILSIRESTRISGATVSTGGISTSETTSLSGTVIRFINPACRE
jgi:hypothetical protein